MDEALTHYRAEGLSSSEIARILNTKFRTVLTRNAVIGRAIRLKLPDRRAVTRAAGRKLRSARAFGFEIRPQKALPRSDGVPKGTPLKSEAIPLPRADDIPTKTFSELEPKDGCCRFRIDRPIRGEPYGFCGKEVLIGLPYCAAHTARVYANSPEVIYRAKAKEKEREKV